MLFIFSTPEIIRNLWQLKTAVFLHWCLLCAIPFCKQIRPPIFLSLEEVAVHARHKLLMKVDNNSALIFGNPKGILDQQFRPHPILLLIIIMIMIILINY